LLKQQAEFEAWTAAEREKIREAHRQIDASRAEFNVERAVHATKVEALRADREQLEQSRSAHESKLAELAHAPGARLRVCPETSGWIAEFSEHEAD
jgi:septal ring factor EnvC (AmiA/AmiB activator)